MDDQSDEHGITPLIWTASKGYRNAVERLLEAGAEVGHKNAKGETVFDVAVKAGRARVVDFLLDAKVGDYRLDKVMGGGKATPLVFSASCGRADIVSVLLESGADATVKDARGVSPLLAAVKHGRSKVVSTLLRSDFGEDLAASADYGKCPLLVRAVKLGFADVVSALLAGGFAEDVDERDVHGATALHWACHKVCLLSSGPGHTQAAALTSLPPNRALRAPRSTSSTPVRL